jgi:hypothetical protein
MLNSTSIVQNTMKIIEAIEQGQIPQERLGHTELNELYSVIGFFANRF